MSLCINPNWFTSVNLRGHMLLVISDALPQLPEYLLIKNI
jgi:hypothetical protein